jgi:hypothetical protein
VDNRPALSAAAGVFAVVCLAIAVPLWQAASAAHSHTPRWPAIVCGVFVLVSLYSVGATLFRWWPFRHLGVEARERAGGGAAPIEARALERPDRTAFLPGSNHVRVMDLLEPSSGLLQSVPWRRFEAPGPAEGLDLLGYLGERLDGGTLPGPDPAGATRFLIVSGAGLGKTVLSIALQDQLGDRAACVPLFKYVDEFTRNGEFGTGAWLGACLDASRPRPSLLILDSLDEFLAFIRPSEVSRILSRPLFTEAAVVFCRASYYNNHLASTDFARRFEKLEVLPWQPTERRRFTRAYVSRSMPLPGLDARTAMAAADDWIESYPDFASLCGVPLQLVMALEFWRSTLQHPPAGELALNIPRVLDRADLFWRYTEELLSAEPGTPGGSTLGPIGLRKLLEDAAWFLVPDALTGEQSVANMDLARFIADRARTSGLRSRDPYRQLLSVPLIDQVGARVRFTHTAFLDYFVAQGFRRALDSGEVEQVNERFQRFIPATASDFLTDDLLQSRRHPLVASQLIQTLKAAFENTAPPDVAGTQGNPLVRNARQQLGFYLGIVAPRAADGDWLRRTAREEPDLWVRRGVVMGLGVGGDAAIAGEYTDRLRTERQGGAPAYENSINIGFNLSFFGDQSVDIRQPEADFDGPRCAHTVRGLLRMLESEASAALWRVALFSIADLGLHRSVSFPDWANTVREEEVRIHRVLDRMQSSPTSRYWPEVAELRDLIAGNVSAT